MESLPNEWSALLGLVFALGLRHGVDADHVATIDALTRLSTRQRRARWCGTLFAAGHGAAVVALVVGVAVASRGWQPPQWLAPLGAWVSITLLALLGIATLRATWRTAPDDVVRLGGLRGRLFGRLLGHGHPAAAAGIGALFALSFDTVSLAVMFAISGSAAGGVGHALLLGLAFAGGMMLTDGANGFWLAHLLRQRGAAAARASRITALAVGGASLVVAAFGALRLASPAADQWADQAGLWLGLGLVALTLAVCGWALVRRRAAPASARAAASTHAVTA
jgi:nickel/cobalt transporter (NiCoT) family protein